MYEEYEKFMAIYNKLIEKEYVKALKPLWDYDVYEIIKEINEGN